MPTIIRPGEDVRFTRDYKPLINLSTFPKELFNFAVMPVDRAAQNLGNLLHDVLATPDIRLFRTAWFMARFWAGMRGMDKPPGSAQESEEVFNKSQQLKAALQNQPGYKALPEVAQRWLDMQIERGRDTEHASLRQQPTPV